MRYKGVFVTGTDTGVGKTFAAGLLAAGLRRQGVDVGIMKPLESGCPSQEGRLVPEDALYLASMAGVKDGLDLLCPYRFAEPLAPGVAAEKNRVAVDLDAIAGAFEELARRHQLVIVEGAGGLLVPIAPQLLTPHLIKRLSLPVLVVAVNRLGTINHTLLTVREAQRLGLEVLGVIINNAEEHPDLSAKTNVEVLKRFLPVPLLGEIPYLPERPGPEQGAEIAARTLLPALRALC